MISIRQMIREIKHDLQIWAKTEGELKGLRLIESAHKWLDRLQKLETMARINIFMGKDGTEFGRGVTYALKKILGEKDAKRTKEKKD